jgi:Predicted pyridoxal phosphate-dependent enzyme apparently involved in regulation of cell wall biogenesis
LPVHVQTISNGLNHNYHKYVVRFEDNDTRKRVKNALNASVHYEIPLSANSMYNSLECRKDACTASKTASNTVLSLPIHAWLTEDEISTIITSLKDMI